MRLFILFCLASNSVINTSSLLTPSHVYLSPMKFPFRSIFMKSANKLYVFNIMINMYCTSERTFEIFLIALHACTCTREIKKEVWHSEIANGLSATRADGWQHRKPRECVNVSLMCLLERAFQARGWRTHSVQAAICIALTGMTTTVHT